MILSKHLGKDSGNVVLLNGTSEVAIGSLVASLAIWGERVSLFQLSINGFEHMTLNKQLGSQCWPSCLCSRKLERHR